MNNPNKTRIPVQPPPLLRTAPALHPSRSVPANRPAVFDADIKHAASRFITDLAARLSQFHCHVPPCPNPVLTLHFLQTHVRALLAERLAPKRPIQGTINAPAARDLEAGAPFLDAIIYNPQRGPLALDIADFSIVNPATCAGVIQIKPSTANPAKLQARLREIALSCFPGRHPACVMGVVIADPDPSTKSVIRRNGKQFLAYEFTSGKWCPIFILFTRRGELYHPYLPAIEALLANLSQLP